MGSIGYDFKYAECLVVFSFEHCYRGKKYSRKSLDLNQLKMLKDRLNEIEQQTWGELMKKGKTTGVRKEKNGSSSWKMINKLRPTQLSSDYFFHFRVGGKSAFRVFGYQYHEVFFITHIDPKGKIHHKSH